jgi:hypothetical protein
MNTNLMNHIRLRTRQLTLCPLSAFPLALCFYFPALANAQTGGQVSGGISTTPTEGVAVDCGTRFDPFIYMTPAYKALSLYILPG